MRGAEKDETSLKGAQGAIILGWRQMTATPTPLIQHARAVANSSKLSPFARVANGVAWLAGRPATFATSCLVIAVWGISGPFFRYSDTWQLVINTGTTIV